MNTNPFDFSAPVNNKTPQGDQQLTEFMSGPMEFGQDELTKMATPTPLTNKAPVPAFHKPNPGDFTNPEEFDAYPAVDPENVTSEIQDAFAVDPITAQSLSRLPDTKDYMVGSYVTNGDVFVFFDTYDANKAYGTFSKTISYNYRFAINMANAGIEPWGSATILRPGIKPISPLDPQQTNTRKIFRAIYKLTRSL